MDWQRVAASFPLLESQDVSFLKLSEEEEKVVIATFNKSIQNASADGSDVAMIALKKLLTKFPSWGEPALLYGICMADEGKYKGAITSFEHSISVGFQSPDMEKFANSCLASAVENGKKMSRQNKNDESESEGVFSSLFKKNKNSSIFDENNSKTNAPMRAPILTRAPRSPEKAMMASDRERREILMQAQSENPDMQDTEIDVSIPITPMERLKRVVLIFVGIIIAVGLFLAVRYFAIPFFQTYFANNESEERLEYIISELEKNSDDPEVAAIIEEYNSKYFSNSESTTSSMDDQETNDSINVEDTTVADDTTAEGGDTTAEGGDTTAEGDDTTAEGDDATAEGDDTTAEGGDATAEGDDTDDTTAEDDATTGDDTEG